MRTSDVKTFLVRYIMVSYNHALLKPNFSAWTWSTRLLAEKSQRSSNLLNTLGLIRPV